MLRYRDRYKFPLLYTQDLLKLANMVLFSGRKVDEEKLKAQVKPSTYRPQYFSENNSAGSTSRKPMPSFLNV